MINWQILLPVDVREKKKIQNLVEPSLNYMAKRRIGIRLFAGCVSQNVISTAQAKLLNIWEV
jgi:hypothetical protein